MLIAEKAFLATIESLEEFINFSVEQAEVVGMAANKIMKFQIALEEIFVNIASYAYPAGVVGNILLLVYYCKQKGHFTLEIIDTGYPFNPISSPAPDVSAATEEREIGGLGIMFVKNMTQDLYYKRENNKNILGLVFYV